MSTRLGLFNQSTRCLGDEFHDLDILLLSFSSSLSLLSLVHGHSIAATASGEFDDTVIDEHPIAVFRPWKMEVAAPSMIGTNPSSLYEATLVLTEALELQLCDSIC